MSHLVPEKRMNVNGHLVTKHVRVTPHDALNRKKLDIPPVSQLSSLYSQEFSDSLTSASAVAELIYSFDENDNMVEPNGEEVHDYGYEEARDAMLDLFPAKTLQKLQKELDGLPEGRQKVILAHNVLQDIHEACERRQNGEPIERMSKISLTSVNDGIALSALAHDFAEPDASLSEIYSAMYVASRSVRRNCSGAQWEPLLPDEDARRQMVEAEFIVSLLTDSRLEYERDKTPEEIYRHRKEVLEKYPLVKKYQGVFRERGAIDITLLDELDKNSSAIREGTL